MKKYTHDFIMDYFKSQSCKLLDVYVNAHISMRYICKCGNISRACFTDFQHSKKCNKCSNIQRLSYEFVKEQFEKVGCQLLESSYINSKTPMKYICVCGNKTTTIWRVFQRGGRCKKCPKKSSSLKYSFEHVRDYFESAGCKLLESKYVSANHKMDYICSCGNKSQITWSNFRQGVRCPYCAGHKAHNGNCLAIAHPLIAAEWHPTKNKCSPYEIVPKSTMRAWWLGKCGHEWDMIIHNRTAHNQQCPYCANMRVCIDNCLTTKFPEIAKQFHSKKNNGLTANDVVWSSHKKIWWLCKNKHEWFATVNSRTNAKTECPECANSSKGEKRIKQLLINVGINYIPQYKFNDCRNKKPLPFDFAIIKNDKIALLIEYQGEQHYYPVRFNGMSVKSATKVHELTKLHDKIKASYCQEKALSLLTIPYWEQNPGELILKTLEG